MTRAIDFGRPQQNGAWLVGQNELDALDRAAHASGHLVRRINLAGCGGRADLFRRTAGALEFPDTFGANWDALLDCLADLGWLVSADGYTWCFDHAGDLRDASIREFVTLCEILDDACARWRRRAVPCFGFLALPDAAFSGPVPAMPQHH